jgi:hypothetical protein
MYYPCRVNLVPSTHTLTVRLGDSLDADRRYKSDGISDTFALMRNDGKLDNQTLHVLNVSFLKFVQHYVTDGKSISSFSDSLVYPFNRNFCLFLSRFDCRFLCRNGIRRENPIRFGVLFDHVSVAGDETGVSTKCF